jgi:hypothetical protein
MAIKVSKYGWKPDRPDHRDLKYKVVRKPCLTGLPRKSDLTPKCPVVYDQADLGSCTANAGGGARTKVCLARSTFIAVSLF